MAASDFPTLTVIPAGIVVVGTGFLWWKLAQRWYSIEHVRFTRMRGIERQLRRPGQASYVQYLNDITPAEGWLGKYGLYRLGLPQEVKAREKHGISEEEAAELQHYNWRNYYRSGPRDYLGWLPKINLVAWLTFAAILLWP